MNFIEVEIKGGTAFAPALGVSVPLPEGRFDVGAHDGKTALLGARPEHLVPLGHGAALDTGSPFEAEIEFSEMLGNETLLFCRKGAVKFVARMQNPRMIEPGEMMTFGIDAERLNLFDDETGASLRQM